MPTIRAPPTADPRWKAWSLPGRGRVASFVTDAPARSTSIPRRPPGWAPEPGKRAGDGNASIPRGPPGPGKRAGDRRASIPRGPPDWPPGPGKRAEVWDIPNYELDRNFGSGRGRRWSRSPTPRRPPEPKTQNGWIHPPPQRPPRPTHAVLNASRTSRRSWGSSIAKKCRESLGKAVCPNGCLSAPRWRATVSLGSPPRVVGVVDLRHHFDAGTPDVLTDPFDKFVAVAASTRRGSAGGGKDAPARRVSLETRLSHRP